MSALAELFRPNPHNQIELILVLVNKGICKYCYETRGQYNKLKILHGHKDLNDVISLIVTCPCCCALGRIVISDQIIDKSGILKLINDYQYMDRY